MKQMESCRENTRAMYEEACFSKARPLATVSQAAACERRPIIIESLAMQELRARLEREGKFGRKVGAIARLGKLLRWGRSRQAA
ncbi:MAG: hypothetical protein KDD66_05415 [Bdellovibrionales bacterium]|nr:hypothetical protein [Bdellovibrionales bacterium]